MRDVDPNTLVRIQFFQWTKAEDGSHAVQWLNSTVCQDFYADEDSETLAKEFSQRKWICPDTSSFDLQADPFDYKYGTLLGVVVNECAVADRVRATTANMHEYTDTACTVAPTETHLQRVEVSTKMMTRFFDPDYFLNYGTLNRIFINRLSAGINSALAMDYTFLLTPTNNTIDTSWWTKLPIVSDF